MLLILSDEGLIIRIRDKLLAWSIKNKVARAGYKTSLEKDRIIIWGAGLNEYYLVSDLESFAV